MSNEEIKKQIAVYEKEIDNIEQHLRMLSNDIYLNSQERSNIGGKYRDQMFADSVAREQQLKAERERVRARIPQLSFEMDRLKAMLNE